MNSGTLVLGVLNGLTIGLLAVGLVLVYKSNRFLNLAHAQLGTLSALLLAKWVLDWGWSWWVAFLLAVAVGTITGLIVERFFRLLRRRGGSPVRLLLLSVAMSQVLLGLTFIPDLSPNPDHSGGYPEPFMSHLRIGGVTLTGTFVLTAILVPIVVLALAAFLRYSMLGKGIRAAANNPDAARLCGISVSRVSAVTWGLAGGMSAISSVLQAPQQPSFNVASLGPYLLMLTLGAAAFGAFVSLPAALGGGLFLGLVSQFVLSETSNGSDAELALFVTILLVVLLRGRAIAKVFALAGGTAEAQPVLRVPEALKGSPLVRYQRTLMGAAAVVVAVVFPKLPYFNREGNRFLLVLVLVYGLIAVGITMLVGWAGQVSLGHFAVVGLAAYLTARWSAHWTLPAILLVAGVIGAAVMVVIGLPALRVGGLALAVTTMGFAVITGDWLLRQSWVGNAQPFATVVPAELGPDLGTPSSQLALYYVALVVLVLAAAGAAALRRYGPGRVVMAVRDNETAATSFGINAASVKLTILAVSGFFAAAGGVLWAETWRTVSTDQFSADLSVAIIALPVIGGLGSVSGAIAASVALYMTTFFVGPHVSGIFGNFGHNIGFLLFLAGMGQVGVLLQAPQGIAGAVRVRWQSYLDHRARVVEQWSAPSRSERRPTAAEAAPRPAIEVAANAPAPEVEMAEAEGTPRGELVPLLVTSGIRVHFGGVMALSDPQVTVYPGEIVGLIGPNGAGKTTLMNVISGLIRPDTGSVRISGREVADLPPDFRAAYGVARAFQDARLFGGLSVRETIQAAMAYRRRVGVVSALVSAPWARVTEARSQQAAEQILERFGLTHWADTLTSELSTGTRRICDLAAQVAAAPQLLLLDEPTAGVAQREAEAFGPLLRRIRAELDCSVLIVEHDMPLLMGLCDRVYAMEAGQVIAEGTPNDVRNNPTVVASYLGNNEAAVTRSGSRTSGATKHLPQSNPEGTSPSNGKMSGVIR